MLKHAPTKESLIAVFEDWGKALNTGRLDHHFNYYHEDAALLDEDFPWNCSKADFIDHIDFHVTGNGRQGLWEFFQWLPRETKIILVGNTGQVSGFSTLRGKVRDAGFRQRFMGFTQNWAFHNGKWQLLSWHQSVLAGRIEGASPA